MSQTVKNHNQIKWFHSREFHQLQNERKNSEQYLNKIANRVNLLQLHQMQVVTKIKKQQRSLELQRDKQTKYEQQQQSRLQMQQKRQQEMLKTQQSVQFRKQALSQHKNQALNQFRSTKYKACFEFKQRNEELQRRIQQQRESEQVKNSVRYHKQRKEREFSQQRSRVKVKPLGISSDIMEREIVYKIRTEQSIRQLEEVEQKLVNEYQNSLLLSNSLIRQLDSRTISKIRAKSYEIRK